MDFTHGAGRDSRQGKWSGLGVALLAASVASLAACGGGGSDDGAASAMLPTAVTPKSCNNIPGSLDGVQAALTGTLRTSAQALPQVGAPAAAATAALSQTLDAVDAIGNALSTLARTQSPQQFSAQLTGAGDSLLCSGSTLSDALSQLASSQGTTVPGLSTVQSSLALVSSRIADGLVGTTPGGDLTLLTNQLAALAGQLRSLSGNLPGSANQPYLREILALNATAFDSLALILADLGALNGSKLSSDTTALLASLAGRLTPTATALGVPASVLGQVSTQLQSATSALNGGLTAVASPTLQAVSAVLGAANGTAGGTALVSFSDLVDGSLAGGAAGAATTQRVNQLSQQLASTNLLTALLQSFGGRLPTG